MSRPTFIMDFANRKIYDLGREHNSDPIRYELELTAEEAKTIRKPQCVIMLPSGRVVWTFVSLDRVSGDIYHLLLHRKET